MHHQDPQVVARKARMGVRLCRAGERQVPRPACVVVHRDVEAGAVACELRTRIDVAPDGGGMQVGRDVARLSPDGQVAVVLQVGVVPKQRRVHARRVEPRIQRVVEPRTGRRPNHQRVEVVSGTGVDVVVGVGATHVHAVRGHAREVARRVFNHHFGLQGVALDRRVDALVAPAVTVGVKRAVSSANADRVDLGSLAVALAFRDFVASALVDSPGTVAHAACIHHAHAFVQVVAHPIAVGIFPTRASANARGIQHVAVAVARALRDVLAQVGVRSPRRARAVVAGLRVVAPLARIKLTRAIVHRRQRIVVAGQLIRAPVRLALLRRSHAVVHVVTDAVGVRVFPGAAAFPTRVEVQARTVVHGRVGFVVAGRRICAPVGVKLARPVVVQGLRIVVHGFLVRAPSTFLRRTNGQQVTEFIALVAVDEHLNLDLTGHESRGGELCDQHLQI